MMAANRSHVSAAARRRVSWSRRGHRKSATSVDTVAPINQPATRSEAAENGACTDAASTTLNRSGVRITTV